jgi:uncharacterized protein YndB with AHSA1/START domain
MNVANSTSFEHKGRVIRTEIKTSATPEQAWEAWADPEKIAQWFVDRATGEAKPGGTMTWFFDKFGYVLPYKIVEAVPGNLIVFKWEAPQGNPGILEVRIEREGGATIVQLINSGFREGAAWDEEYEGVSSGWTMALAILKFYLENHFARKKTTIFIFQPAKFTYEEVLQNFLDPTRLARWLTTAGAIGKVGGGCDLQLRDAGKLTGRVLAITDREVTLSWDEIGGVLELKAFAMGPQRVVCVRVMSWRLNAEQTAQLEQKLNRAVERLAAHFPDGAVGGDTSLPSVSQEKPKSPFEERS